MKEMNISARKTARQWLGGLVAVSVMVAAGGLYALAELPHPGMEIDLASTALVITDPQNDFLSPEGVAPGDAFGAEKIVLRIRNDNCSPPGLDFKAGVRKLRRGA